MVNVFGFSLKQNVELSSTSGMAAAETERDKQAPLSCFNITIDLHLIHYCIFLMYVDQLQSESIGVEAAGCVCSQPCVCSQDV